MISIFFFFFSSRRRHTRCYRDWSSDVCSSELEWGNIKAGQAWAAKHTSEDKAAAELCIRFPDAGAYCLDLRLHPRERIGWLETSVDACRKLRNRRAEGNRLGNLGLAYDSLGEYRRAIEFHE